MKNFTKGFYPTSKMHLCCGGSLHYAGLDCILFKNGFAYASNEHIAIKNGISEISNFDPDEIEILDGKAIKGKIYSELLKEHAVNINASGFHCFTKGVEKHYPFSVPGKVPDIERVFTETGLEPLDVVGLNPVLLETLQKALPDNFGVRLEFHGPKKAISVYPIDRPNGISKGLIFPMIVYK